MVQSSSVQKMMRRVLQTFRYESGHGTRFANVAHLLTGNFLGSLLGLAAFALTARALGPVDYGKLAMVYAFVRVVERVISFQSWQPIIKYGSHLQGPEDRTDLRVLLKFGLLLDAGAAGSAWLVAILIVVAAAPVFGWQAETIQLLLLYSSVLLFRISGMPTAVLRIAGKFRLIAYGQQVNSAVRVALCFVGSATSAGLGYFAAVWAGTQILGSLILLALAMRTLRQQGIQRVLAAPTRGVTRRFPGIWSFAWSANLSSTLRMSAQEVDTLLVGALADPAAAGLYHIAKRIGRVGQQVGAQVQAVLYPDVTRLWARGRVAEFKRVVLQVEAFLLGFGLVGIAVVAAMAHPLLVWTAGPEFLDAAPLVIVQMVAVTFVLSGSAARVALLAMGRQREVLGVVILATAVFYVVALLLIPMMGPMGGNIAHIALGIVWAAGLGLSLHRALKAHRPATLSSASVRLDSSRDTDLLVSKGI